MDIRETWITERRAYHNNLKILYKILLKIYSNSGLIIWGAGKGYEIPEENLERILALDISETLVKDMRRRGINAFVANFLENYLDYGRKEDVVIVSLLLSQLLYLGEKPERLRGIIYSLSEKFNRVIVLDTPYWFYNIKEYYSIPVAGIPSVNKVFSCHTYYKNELETILKGYPKFFLCSSDAGPIIVNPIKDQHLYKFGKQWLIFVWFINFEREEVKRILKEYISKCRESYFVGIKYLKKCVKVVL